MKSIIIPEYPLFGSCRIIVVMMTFISFFLHYFIRINMSLAIVCMVKTKIENITEFQIDDSSMINITNPGDHCVSQAGAINITDTVMVFSSNNW